MIYIKTMTCRQMGGPCDAKLSGTTADDVIKAGEMHIQPPAEKSKKAKKDEKNDWKTMSIDY